MGPSGMAAQAAIHAKNNNFGALRLLFAALVIFSHSPAIVFNDRSTEPMFGPVTLGEVAVDGFFIVSGYLITKSFVGSVSALDYFRKRVLRIYPGFVVNAALCVFVLAPLVGAPLTVFNPLKLIDIFAHFAFLLMPVIPGAFGDMVRPALNGAAWTIPYEFRCYILVAALGLIASYARLRPYVLGGAFACLFLTALDVLPWSQGGVFIAIGSPPETVRLTGIFMFGMAFYLYRDRIPYRSDLAAAAAALLIASAFLPVTTNFGLAICGAYLIFWFALHRPVLRISAFANETDISYGVYLYAWPIQMTLVHVFHLVSPWAVSFATLALSSAFAYASWIAVEKPALKFAHRGAGRAAPAADPVEDRKMLPLG